ncbi:hypothetical protein M9H77_07031 [Catharanthus roseus]|uniref:Uncharacterized protein n=1 Tax=Catharanthus roseus TaxID=4058 RepID=A0ACC0BTS8_CATRO|nr:hypothetical protein M9H77_07031 [Catharanthus roseus]
MKKPRGPFNLNLVVWKGTLETMRWIDSMKIMDSKHILKRILTTKLDKVTFKKVMRDMKVLGIPTWMMDMGIGIHMSKKLGTMERKPMNLKRA